MTNDAANFDTITPYTGNDKVLVKNGASLSISHTISPKSGSLPVFDVAIVPSFTKKLSFISKFTTNSSCSLTFLSFGFTIEDLAKGQVLGNDRCKISFYVFSHVIQAFLASPWNNTLCVPMNSWYTRLGHVSFKLINMLNKQEVLFVSSSFLQSGPSLCNSLSIWEKS